MSATTQAEDTKGHTAVELAVVSKEESKDYNKARNAFATRDLTATRREHAKPHVEHHKTGASDYLKSLVFGGLDGIMTTFAIVTAAAGSNADFRTVLVFGFANVIADAFSMGFGEFVSGSAERDFAVAERKREEWEVEVDADMEKKEMVELYEKKGICHEDAVTMVDIISKDPKIFVDFMMIDELQILCDLEDQWEPLKQGAVMFLAFISFGTVALLPYLAGHGRGTDGVFQTSCFLVFVALLALGAVKGHLTSMSIPKASAIMAFNGAVSGGVSYVVGIMVQNAVANAAGPGPTCAHP